MIASQQAQPRILIVDDDENVRFSLEAVLRLDDNRCIALESGEAALEWLESYDADLMLVDLAMGGMTGKELVQKLGETGRQLPFIVISGRSDHATTLDMMRLGAMDYLTKGEIDRDVLLGAVRRALRRIGQERQIAVARAEQARLTAQLKEERHRLEDLLAIVPGLIWEVAGGALGQAGRLRYVNGHVESLLGYTVKECLADSEFLERVVHPDDRLAVGAEMAAVIAGRGHDASQFRMVTKGGRVVWVDSHVVATRDAHGQVVGLRGVTMDVTTSYWAGRRRDLLLAVTTTLSGAVTLTSAAVPILEAVCGTFAWTLGEFWSVDPEARVLRYSAGWHPAAPVLDSFEAASRRSTFSLGSGLPGTAWAGAKALWVDALDDDPRLAQTPEARAHDGLRGAFAYPVVFYNNVLGVFVFYARNIREVPASHIVHLFDVIGGLIGQFIQRRHAEGERARLEREILESTAAAQRRIGNDLHDDLCQRLVGIQLISDALSEELTHDGSPRAGAAGMIATHLGDAVARARKLARGLSPVEMDAHGLMAALRQLVEDSTELFRVRCVFECPSPVAIDRQETSTHLYHIAQESIANAVRHGHAHLVTVSLTSGSGHGVLEVADDGIGIPDNARAGMGLRTMHYRANVIGAAIRVDRIDGSGTRVRCNFSLPSASKDQV